MVEQKKFILPGLISKPEMEVKQGTKEEERGTFKSGNSNPPTLEHGRIQDNNLTNQDGQPLENSSLNTGFTGTSGSSTEVKTDQHERVEERDHIVIDRVSGDPVLVQGRFKEDKLEEYKKLLDDANKSLNGAKVGEIGLSHSYHGLMETARQFGKAHGLI